MASINTSSVYRITGLASGLDIDQMVSELMKAQRAPLTKLLQTKQIWQWKQEDYRKINTSLLNLRNVVFNLKLQGTFKVKKAVSSDESIVTATATGSAAPGIYNIKVTQLASGVFWQSKKLSDEKDNNGQTKALATQLLEDQNQYLQNSNITFTLNDQEISIDLQTDTIYTLVSKINEKTNSLGIVANYDAANNLFYITTTSTGSQVHINIQDAEIEISDGTNVTSVYLFKDLLGIKSAGSITITENITNGTVTLTENGNDATICLVNVNSDNSDNYEITSSTNTVTIAGLSLTLKNTGNVTVTVSNDIDAVVNTIKDFVNKYNETLAAINAELKEERYPDYLPLTDEQIQEGKLTDKQIDQWQEKARSGLLKGDPLLISVVSSIRAAMASIVEGVTGQVTVTSGGKQVSAVANSLSVIGITTGLWVEEGKLYLDENRLREALQSNPDAVMELFTRSRYADGSEIKDSKQQGIAVRLYNVLNSAISRITSEAGSPSTLYDQSYISRLIRDLDKRISDTEERLKELEDRYYRQFTALEEAIARMNVQSMWLAQQLSAGGGR